MPESIVIRAEKPFEVLLMKFILNLFQYATCSDSELRRSTLITFIFRMLHVLECETWYGRYLWSILLASSDNED